MALLLGVDGCSDDVLKLKLLKFAGSRSRVLGADHDAAGMYCFISSRRLRFACASRTASFTCMWMFAILASTRVPALSAALKALLWPLLWPLLPLSEVPALRALSKDCLLGSDEFELTAFSAACCELRAHRSDSGVPGRPINGGTGSMRI